MGINGVTACQNKIGLEVFSDDDMQFLKAYVEVMKPLALAMDKLQGEKQCYIGHVIPTICGMIFKLNMMTDKSVLPLTKVLMNGLKTRFMDIMSSDDYNIATMLVPQFKLNYLEQCQRSIKRALLVEAVKKMEVSEVVTTTVQAAAIALNSPLKEINDTPDDLYSYMISENTDKQNADLVGEIDTYLSRTETNVNFCFSIQGCCLHLLDTMQHCQAVLLLKDCLVLLVRFLYQEDERCQIIYLNSNLSAV